jgi:hypothetical protein
MENETREVPSNLLEIPDHLSDAERDIFKRIFYEMVLAGVDVQPIDEMIISVLASQLDILRSARAGIDSGAEKAAIDAYTEIAAEYWSSALVTAKQCMLDEEALNRLLAPSAMN